MKHAVLALALIAAPAWAETPAYVGHWAAELPHCANLPQSDSGPEIIDATGVFGWEYSCDIAQIDPLDLGKAWQVRLECLDAGFRETWFEMWFITVEDQLLRIGPEGYWGIAHRCPATNTQTSE